MRKDRLALGERETERFEGDPVSLQARDRKNFLPVIGDVRELDSELHRVPPPAASWGSMVASGRDVMTDAWWITTFPGIAIVLTVMSFNLVGDGLRDALDPRATTIRAG